MITIDGSLGEGGGQVLRTSLALSVIHQTPLSIHNIRANRRPSGLRRQHLTGALAAAEICGGELEGGALKSTELKLAPDKIEPGTYSFSMGTAGSTTLVLQTILLPLWLADGPSEVTVEGGTHNQSAPPYDFLKQSFLPLLNRMGGRVDLELEGWGFYPAGGGRISCAIEPPSSLNPFHLTERGPLVRRRARAIVSRLPRHIATCELKVVKKSLGWKEEELEVVEVKDSRGPGNILILEIEFEGVTEVFTGFGRKGVKAEDVARRVCREVKAYLDADVAVGEHLADQLLMPMALGEGGSFTTTTPSLHTKTQAEVIRKFMEVDIHWEELGPKRWEVVVKKM